MKHIASCSFGKDSLATIILALEHGEPLDEVVYCEVMFDKEISGEVPEHKRFIEEIAIPFIKSNGVKVTHLKSAWTFMDHFNFVITKGPRKGKLRGWPICGICSICRDCKLPPLREYKRSLGTEAMYYVGISDDEQDRLVSLDQNSSISLLEKYKVDKMQTIKICKREGLLSPIYEFSTRNGCFFCPNAKWPELRHLYDHHPDLWARLMECQRVKNKASEKFNREFRFDEIDGVFKMEDAQLSLFDH